MYHIAEPRVPLPSTHTCVLSDSSAARALRRMRAAVVVVSSSPPHHHPRSRPVRVVPGAAAGSSRRRREERGRPRTTLTHAEPNLRRTPPNERGEWTTVRRTARPGVACRDKEAAHELKALFLPSRRI